MKNISAKLQDTSFKILKWTCRAEDALSRKQAQKCLRKIAKHSLKLAKLQGRAYTLRNKEDT
jgi:hypothetical protein